MSANNYAVRLQSIKTALEKAKTDRARAEATKESLEKQRDAIVEEIKSMGFEPENLDATIAELDTQIQSDLVKLEQLIPAEYRG
jgi:chromosome segregation ATPase